MSLLECRDVIKIYESQRTKEKVAALRGIDLNIKRGDFVSIIGPAGVGKTTLLNCLALIDRPSSGEIILDSKKSGKIVYSKITALDFVSIRSNLIGFLYQLPERNLMYNLSAVDNVTFPMKAIGKYTREERKKRALELLELLGILDRKDHKPPQLSGGESQRLGICIALANDPEIILADEPTGELDSLNTFSIINYFKKLNQELGKTFIVVTHDHRFASQSKDTYSMQDGKIRALSQAPHATATDRTREEYSYIHDDGSIQIPKKYLAQYNLEKTCKLIPKDEGLLIVPTKKE